jgi:FG-GAP repeat
MNSLRLAILLTISLTTSMVLSLPATAEVCLDRQLGDSNGYLDSIVANQNYLVVGESTTNRVVIYRRAKSGQWNRFRTISPPADSFFSTISYGFGRSVALSGDTLVIGAYAQGSRLLGPKPQIYPFQPPGNETFAGAVYRTQVSSNAPLQRIDRPNTNELAGFSITADQGKIAFTVSTLAPDGKIAGRTVVLSGSQQRSLPISGELAISKNRLVVGSSGTNLRQSQISIFDLDKSNLAPQTIQIPIRIAGINLTDKFIVVTENKYAYSTVQSDFRTLILDIPNLSRTFLDGIGQVSTAGNLLVRSHSASPDNEVGGKIEFFDLSATSPKLIRKQDAEIHSTFLTKDFLFASISRNGLAKICITPRSEIL